MFNCCCFVHLKNLNYTDKGMFFEVDLFEQLNIIT